MSSALAIAAVTAALKDLLNDGLLNHDLNSIGSFSVSATPPDRISTAPNEPNQLNLFLYHLTANPGWRNAGMPSRDAGGQRLSNPPLALDLHYLLSSYGSDDFNAEILLGYAMQLLHNHPVLTRDQLRTVLGGISPVDGSMLPSPFGTMSAADLADQVELIKITPNFLSPDEMSKMWTAMQSRYRLSMAYTVSVVLIQDTAPVKQALPVLQRGQDDRGFDVMPGWPQLDALKVAAFERQPALRLGERFLLSGSNLDQGTGPVLRFEHMRSGLQRELTPEPGILPAQLAASVPALAERPQAMSEWAIGAWQVSLASLLPSGKTWVSNRLATVVAPRISVSPLLAAVGNVSLSIECSPRILPQQESTVLLIFGQQTALATSLTTPADPLQPSTLVFDLVNVPAGSYVVRLRVDGADSLPVSISGNPKRLSFDPQQTVVVA